MVPANDCLTAFCDSTLIDCLICGCTKWAVVFLPPEKQGGKNDAQIK